MSEPNFEKPEPESELVRGEGVSSERESGRQETGDFLDFLRDPGKVERFLRGSLAEENEGGKEASKVGLLVEELSYVARVMGNVETAWKLNFDYQDPSETEFDRLSDTLAYALEELADAVEQIGELMGQIPASTSETKEENGK